MVEYSLASVIEPHAIAEADHRILNGFTDEQLMLLGRVARVGAGTTVLDLASGKGELLCRWAQELGSTGHGVDVWPPFVAAAQSRAVELGAAVTFSCADAAGYVATEPVDVACCLGATWIGGGVGGTVELLRRSVRPGGLVIIGEPYWIDPPPEQAFAAIGCDPDEWASLPGLLDRFEAAGAELIEMVLSDGASWDRYMAAQWFTVRAWLTANPGHRLHGEMAGFLERTRRGYLTYQRRYLGWGAFVLQV